jgi:hypothetical protein
MEKVYDKNKDMEIKFGFFEKDERFNEAYYFEVY